MKITEKVIKKELIEKYARKLLIQNKILQDV